MQTTLVDRERFIGGHSDRTFLFTAAEGLGPQSAIDAVRRYYDHKADPASGRTRQAGVAQETRERLARLHATTGDEIALLGNASQGISAIYALIDWEAGDNVVLITPDLEFPSVGLPALKLVGDIGIEVRVVEHNDWIVTPDRLAEAIDERTRLVFASHISYRTGFRLDIEAVGSMLEGTPAIFAVDATQSLGVVPVPAGACDFVVSTSGKWMLGPYGVGPLYWNRERRPDVQPRDIGWFSVIDDLAHPYVLKQDAGRFEVGSLDWPAIYALNEGLKIIDEAGVENIEHHVIELGGRLLDELREFDVEVITPPDPGHRGGIVSWLDADAPATAAQLAEHGVYVTGSSGRIRAAFHLYNDESDVERLVAALAAIQR